MSNVITFPLSSFLSHPDALPVGKASYVRVFPHPRGGWAMAQQDDGGGFLTLYPTKVAAVREALWHVETFNAEMEIANTWEGWA